ncbi:hypothetical protein FHL15_007821 [Xylaria flabelliformis]|uniref:Nudix hydrolase domain-containing protein n=1 Tax=Xylaria flabelliformis TaxID=2512241 RepID=A0A553HTE0_9PEZI|nr:hypothetical protein FHL15_007821 [Xylaria flabelliformis]
MSRAQYFTYLRSSLGEDEPQQAKSIPNSKKDDRDDYETKKKKNLTHPPPTDDDTPTNPAAADKLSVGVCIFRLDGRTLSPAVLLLRRSPRWWRRRIFTSVGGRHGAGEWELPGGKVENDDFCISAAIERLVREKTGLRVTKIMFMLSDVRWREELKVLLWEEEEEEDKEAEKSTSGDSNENGNRDNSDGDDEVEIRVDLAAAADDVEWSSSIASSEDSVVKAAADDGIGIGVGNSSTGTGIIARDDDEMISSRGEEEALMSLDLETLGIRFPVDSSSPASSAALLRLTMDSSGSSSVVSAPPVPPKDPGRYAWGYREHNNGPDANEYHADHECFDNDCHSRYESNKKNHDPSLKPAPLSLPSRKPKLPLPGHRHHRKTEAGSSSSTAAAAALRALPLLEHMHMHTLHWRDAQMIPYKMVRKEYVQLNFTVLVDEPDNDEHEHPLPEFLRRRWHAHAHAHADGADGDGDRKEKEIYEHDALEWATCARLKKLPMSEDLRRVVFEGLAWMGTLTGGFF